MSKKIIYTDEFGNKIDVNSIEGIHVVLNDIFATCDNENSCLCVKENIKASIEKCYETRKLVQKFLNKWTIFLFCSILFSSNQKEH